MRRRFPVVAVLLAASTVGSLGVHYTYTGFPRPPFQEAAAYLQPRVEPTDVVVHTNKLSYFPTRYYAPDLPGVFLADPPGSPQDTLARPTQEALDFFATSTITEAVGLCLIVTNLVALHTATTNYVVLFLPLVMTFRALQRGRSGAWLVLLVEVVLLAGMWALFLTTVTGKFEHPVVYLPLPFGLLAVFALARRCLLGRCLTPEVIGNSEGSSL